MGPRSAIDSRRRALELFERMLDLAPDRRGSEALLAGEPAEVLMEIAALEAAEERAAETFRTDFGADAGRPAGERPARVGPYRLDAPIGEGGMGEVWRGLRDDGLFELEVAVKLIRPAILSPAAEARFDHERRALARLSHPGIARIIDGGVSDGGWPYLVTELVDGAPLDRHCAATRAPLRERVRLVRDAAGALHAAHARLIVHADVKPGNLLVSDDGRVRLVDFGIARLVDAGPEPAALQPMTPAYASPERRAGAAPAPADDIYALGIVLRDLAGPARADRGVAAIVARATAPAAADRYPTIEAMGLDLDRWLAGRPVAAHPPSPRYRALCFARRHRFGAAAAALAALALALAAGAGIAGHLRTQQARAAEAARSEDLRAVSHYLLFELQSELARQPNSLALRTRIAERLQRYLDRMAAEPGASPAIRLEAAEGLMSLADEQADPGQANLGQAPRARRNLERAAALVARVPGARAAVLRARLDFDLARVLIAYDQNLGRADGLLAAAGRELDAAGPAGARLRGEWLTNRAILRGWQDRHGEAIADARAAMRALPPRDPRAAALLAAQTLDILAESTFYAGDPAGSLPPYREALRTLEGALDRWPADRKVRRDVARANWALGSTLVDRERYPEALARLAKGLAVADALVAEDRDDADAERLRNVVELAYSQALARAGRSAEALAVMSANVARRGALWRARPGEARRLRDFMIATAALGDMEAESGHVARACRTYAEAEAIFAGQARAGTLLEADRAYSYRLLEESRARYCPR